MAFFNFFKPKWQHSNPAVRLKALEALTDSDVQILLQIASTDRDASVRQVALGRINDWRILTPLENLDIDAAIKIEIEVRIDTLQRDAVDTALSLNDKLTALAAISKDELLAEVVLGEAETEIRLAAIDRIVSQAVLADLVTKNCGKAPALLAIEKIDDESLLRMAAKQASNRVARAKAQRKVEEIETARNRPDPETLRELELAELVKKAKLLTEAVNAEAALHECRQLQQRWRELAGDDSRTGEFETHCAFIRSRQQKQTAEEMARRVKEAEESKRLERLTQILVEIETLTTTATGEEESRLQSLQHEWTELLQPTISAVPDTLLIRYNQANELLVKNRTIATQEKKQEADLLSQIETVVSLIEIEQQDLNKVSTQVAEVQRAFDNWRPGFVNRQQVTDGLFRLREQLQAEYARREEVERLQLEVNWQQRQELLTEAKSLLANTDVRAIDQRLAEIKTRWKQPVELPADVTDLEPEFAEVVAVITERLEVAQKEEAWLRWQNKNLKTQLIAEAETLEEETNLHQVFKSIKELQEQWRAIGAAPAKEEPGLWRKFHEATDRNFARCRTFFQELDAAAERNLEEKIVLRDQAIASQESIEWQKTTEFFKNLQARWKEIGRGPQDKEQEVYTAFRSACDRFFERRKAHQAELDHERLMGLERKEALCLEAEALADQADIEQKTKFQELQTSWKAIGPVPREQEDAIWQRFRAACDRYYGWLDSLRPENLTLKESLCVEVEELTAQLGAETNYIQLAKKIIALQQRWKDIGPVPIEAQDTVWQRFKGQCDDFFSAKSRHDQMIDQQRPKNQAEKEAFLARVRDLSAAPTISKETVREIIGIQEAWLRVGPAGRDHEQQLQRDFRSACDSFFKERREAFEVIDQLHRENLKKKEALCLRLEILAGVTPQPAIQTSDRLSGMTLAEQLKVAFETNFVLNDDDEQNRRRKAKDEINAVVHEWQQIGPVPREHEHGIRKRYNGAMAAAAKI